MTIASAAVAAPPSIAPVVSHPLYDQGDSRSTGFAEELNDLSSSEDSEPAAAQPTVSAPPRKLSAPVRDPKKENNTQGVAIAVTLPGTNATILPLQFQFPTRDGDDGQPGDSSSSDDLQQGKAGSGASGIAAAWNAAMRPDQDLHPAESDKTAPAQSAGSGVAAGKPELAFAARVQPAAQSQDVATNGRQNSEPQMAAASASALRKASNPDQADASAGKDAAPPAPSASGLQHAAAAFEQTARAADSASPSQAGAPPRPADIGAAQPDSPPKPVTPLKDISFNVTQTGAEKVEIRVVQQAGEVHVAVRTGDTDLAHGLRQGLPELVGRLEDNGYRADTWRPGGSTAPAAPLAQSQDSQSASGHARDGDSPGQKSGSQQNSGQQNQNAFNRPRWVEELEGSLAGNGESTGETYGIGS